MRRKSLGQIVSIVALLGAPAVAAAAVVTTATPAGAATLTPVSTADGGLGSGSLRDLLENTAANGDTVMLQPGATYNLTDCPAFEIDVNAAVTIDGGGTATIHQTCPGVAILLAHHNLTVRGVTFSGGVAPGDAGAIDLRGGNTWSITGSTFANNTAIGDDAGAVDVHTLGNLTISNSTFTNNHAGDDGGAIDCENNGSTMRITGSTFNGNATLTGSFFSGGAIDLESDCSLSVLNSTFTNNNSGDGAAITQEHTTATGTVSIAYSTIVNNQLGGIPTLGVTAASRVRAAKADPQDGSTPSGPIHAKDGGAANLAIATPGNLTVFGSVIALPQGGTNCSNTSGVPLSGVVSQGYNRVDDTTCGLAAATDQQVTGSALLLGQLASNGGPTQTLLPQTGSPLIDAIPVAACQTGLAAGVTVDQRGLTRPALNGCDVGAVEVQAAAVAAVPRFTG